MRFAWALAGLAALWAALIFVAPTSALVHFGASYICHQRPERSFHLEGRPLPVCARCTGLYVAAPFGLAAAALFTRRRRPADDRTYRRWRTALILAAVPTAISVGLEWLGGPGLSSNVSRALTAFPLGATVAALLGAVAAGHFARGPSDTLAVTAPTGDSRP